MTLCEGFLPTKSRLFDRMVMRGHMTRNALYLCFHKIYKHQTWHNGQLGWALPTYKVIWLLISWLHEVTWQIWNVLLCIPQNPLSSNVAEWWLSATDSHPLSHVDLCSCDRVRSHGKLKVLGEFEKYVRSKFPIFNHRLPPLFVPVRFTCTPSMYVCVIELPPLSKKFHDVCEFSNEKSVSEKWGKN